jgi:hypothetical protein
MLLIVGFLLIDGNRSSHFSSLNKAIDEIDLFGNQNTECAPKTPKWVHAIERLKSAFPKYDSIGGLFESTSMS